MRFFYYLLALAMLFLSVTQKAIGQCNVTINTSSPSVPCGGGNITLTATGTGYNTTPINNTFDLGNAGPNWTISPSGQFNNPCGPSVDGGIYMWMGSTTAAPRTLQTAPLDLTCGGDVCFYLKFATQGYSAPCEGPDLTNEGVYFQYSLNGGTNWTTINYFQPNPGGNSGPYLNWAQYCFAIPAVAQTSATIFRWYQGGSSGFSYDHWGIDNVIVSATNCGSVWYDWDNISGTTGPTGDPATQSVFVAGDSTFSVCYTDGNQFNCCQNITITVDGMNSPTANVIDETCAGDNDGFVTLSASGGVGPYLYTLESGPGITVPLSGFPLNGTENFSSLAPGNYTYSVQDAGSNCSVTGSFTVAPGPICCTLAHTVTSSDLTCNSNNGTCDGSFEVLSTGAAGNVLYTLTNTNVSQNSPIFNNLCAGNYTILLTDDNNCTSTSSFTISEPSPIIPNLNISDVSCFSYCDGSATVNPTNINGNYSSLWTNSNGINLNNTNMCAGFYNVLITDDAGCTVQVNNFEITEPAEFLITDVSLDSESCVGFCDGSIIIDAPGAVNYSIDNGNSLIGNNTFNLLCPDIYDIIVFDNTGCFDDTTISINPATPIDIVLSPDTVICQNGTANLTAVASGGFGSFDYYWDNTIQNSTINVNPNSDQMYTVYAMDNNGCTSQSLSVNVGVLEALSLTYQANYSICEGDNLTLPVQVTGGDGNYAYEWFDMNTGSLISVSQSANVNPSIPTNYAITVDDGCETTPASGSISVSIYSVPAIQITASPNTGCTPLSVDFISTTNLSNVESFNWDLGITNSSDTFPSVIYEDEDCYDITFSLVTFDGCVNALTIPDLVCSYLTPTANFQFADNSLSSLENSLLIINSSSNADTYNWDISSSEFNYFSSDLDVQVNLPFDLPSGELNVCLEAYTDFGCSDSLCKPISFIEDALIYIPNTFTPDGDQFNNVFKPELSGIDIYNYRLEIFNRWGEKLFESNNPSIGWDGRYNNEIVKSDTYVWKIQYTESATGVTNKPLTGHINLIR